LKSSAIGGSHNVFLGGVGACFVKPLLMQLFTDYTVVSVIEVFFHHSLACFNAELAVPVSLPAEVVGHCET